MFIIFTNMNSLLKIEQSRFAIVFEKVARKRNPKHLLFHIIIFIDIT